MGSLVLVYSDYNSCEGFCAEKVSLIMAGTIFDHCHGVLAFLWRHGAGGVPRRKPLHRNWIWTLNLPIQYCIYRKSILCPSVKHDSDTVGASDAHNSPTRSCPSRHCLMNDAKIWSNVWSCTFQHVHPAKPFEDSCPVDQDIAAFYAAWSLKRITRARNHTTTKACHSLVVILLKPLFNAVYRDFLDSTNILPILMLYRTPGKWSAY